MQKITVVGLGPGSAGQLSVETMELLKNGECVILRTAVHPSVARLTEENVKFISCDHFYEEGASFEDVYDSIVKFVLEKAQTQEVVYAVPGSPLVAERTVVLLRERAAANNTALKILPSMSFLDLAYVELGIDPIAGLRIIDSSDFEALADAGKYPLMITQVYSKFVASDVKLALMDVLDDETPVWFLRNLGLPDEECRTVPLYELDRQENIDHLTSVFVPAQEQVSVMDVRPLTEVMATLRSPGGCPWDMEQTHASIRKSLIEEVYELLEAIDNMDYENMKEELGDVLLQVVFHARLAEEAGAFTMQDVVDEIVEKLIRRHPHVYGTIEVAGSSEVLQNWDAIKQEEKKERTHVLDGVTKGQPALLRAYKLNSKAAKVGFDWPDNEGVWNKITEELAELKEAVATGTAEEQEHELGDLLFSVAAYAKHIGLEPETALNMANNRFVKRFAHVEACVEKSGKSWQDFTLAELDRFWHEAKTLEKTCEKN